MENFKYQFNSLKYAKYFLLHGMYNHQSSYPAIKGKENCRDKAAQYFTKVFVTQMGNYF